jgi:OOP family OmpA-OmpF porin
MLTAIRNFVEDSFNVAQGDSLDALRFGGLALWIEQGSEAILAGVIRGNAPKELRLFFQNSLIQIHQKYHNKFDAFEGDTELFLDSQAELKSCLQAQYESEPLTEAKSSKSFPMLWMILGAVTIAIATWAGLTIRDNLRWSAFLYKLNAEQGIVITKAEKHWGKYFISGLRDPLAVDPNKIVKSVKLNPENVVSQWKPYVSLEPALLTARVKKMLKPPKTVSLKVDENGILYAKGSASQQWIMETRKRVQFIPGINQFQERELVGLGLTKNDSNQIEMPNIIL